VRTPYLRRARQVGADDRVRLDTVRLWIPFCEVRFVGVAAFGEKQQSGRGCRVGDEDGMNGR
jgi:hypothetical protein